MSKYIGLALGVTAAATIAAAIGTSIRGGNVNENTQRNIRNRASADWEETKPLLARAVDISAGSDGIWSIEEKAKFLAYFNLGQIQEGQELNFRRSNSSERVYYEGFTPFDGGYVEVRKPALDVYVGASITNVNDNVDLAWLNSNSGTPAGEITQDQLRQYIIDNK
ncbi:MAG: hypothetical protein IIA87_05395 [Nanoarchaeota archaeon]|nr:hypothetical protein [Nanoarchaeota archaeon]